MPSCCSQGWTYPKQLACTRHMHATHHGLWMTPRHLRPLVMLTPGVVNITRGPVGTHSSLLPVRMMSMEWMGGASSGCWGGPYLVQQQEEEEDMSSEVRCLQGRHELGSQAQQMLGSCSAVAMSPRCHPCRTMSAAGATHAVQTCTLLADVLPVGWAVSVSCSITAAVFCCRTDVGNPCVISSVAVLVLLTSWGTDDGASGSTASPGIPAGPPPVCSR
jgi:hypothetical protein